MFPTIDLDSINLQVSRRITHQLSTRVFAIFLKEVLDFKNIEFDDELDNIGNLPGKYKEFMTLLLMHNMKNASLNLEVWKSPDFHYMFPDRIFEGSSLTNDNARYGLYIPSSLLNINSEERYSFENFQANNPVGRYHKIIQDFSIDENMKSILMKNTEKIECSKCNNGVYRPQHCQSLTEKCATVLTSFYNDTNFFMRHVDELKLKMNIYFLGKNLRRTMKELDSFYSKPSNKQKPKYLIFHWTPSEITDGSVELQSVIMPKCELYNAKTQTGCKYEISPISVYFNEKVKESDDLVDILRRFSIPSLTSLLKIYKDKEEAIERYVQLSEDNENRLNSIEEIYNNISCEWLNLNFRVFEYKNKTSNQQTNSWIRNSNDKRSLSIGGIFPQPDSGSDEYAGIEIALRLAQRDLDMEPDVLPGYNIELKKVSCECKADVVLRNFISYYSHRKHLVGVLGPACSEAVEPIAGISKQLKISVISYSAEGISFEDRDQYPSFFRTIGETTQYENVYAELFTKLNWKRIAALTEDGQKYTEYISHMETSVFQNKAITLIVNKKFTRDLNKNKQIEKIKEYLPTLKTNHRAKIIICDIHDYILVQSIMCRAKDSEMTAKHGYVWFLPVYVSMKLKNMIKMKETNGLCSISDLREAMNGHFSLSYVAFDTNFNRIMPNGKSIGQWQKEYLSQRHLNKTQFSDYAGYTYDAVWVYIRALQLMRKDDIEHDTGYLRNLNSEATTKQLSKLIHEMRFQGVSGYIQFDTGGSRIADIDILQWQNEFDDFVLVGRYKPKVVNRTIESGELMLNESLIRWGSSERPDDGTEICAFQTLAEIFNFECRTVSTILLMLLCIIIVLLGTSASFWFWKIKYDKKLEESTQIMKNLGIVVNGIELTKWEIPRENVVINRRLGEGAFGTVYGGEALINEADGWSAVAIKTLKPGSNAENRLDFLAESETMKRFDHKNIVRLLAVCLQNEPLYTILELMLYGDLKNFLLARRHLVNDKINDDSDISPKRLTLMALDIARALSYLASMNFVHRDVACRNCMINGQRIVKLGDFGMSREIFESSYYRFARKGMLPVRWMAPESIDGGIFSHASDVWSYGILLYEIITLGAFPFQGMNNNQVLDHVKLGNSIKIPQKCKPHLRALMNACFSFDSKKRPEASTIVEYISNYPRMLTPCMDNVPKPCLDEQVDLIENNTDQLERLEPFMDPRDRSNTPIVIDFLRTSSSSSALQNHPSNTNINQHQEQPSFEYLDMKLPKKPNGIYLNDFHPDLTATLPNGNYNPVEPLLQQASRPEISKSNLSLMKYMPMCGFGNKNNSNRSSPDECTSSM